MLPIAQSPPPCGTAMLHNPGQRLRRITLPVLPGAPDAVTNRICADPAMQAPAAALSSEMTRVAEALGSEMIDWGSAIGAMAAARAAERLVPGLSLPLVAYRMFCSLCHARRGELLRALHALPMTAVVPAVLWRALAGWLQAFVPDAPRSGIGHEPIVLGIAACALIHELQREGARQPPATPLGRSLIGLLRCLRTLVSLGSGLHTVMALRSPPSRPALQGSADVYVAPRQGGNCSLPTMQALATAFPVAARGRALPSPHAMDGAASAWPLVGADARKRGTGISSAKTKAGLSGTKTAVGRPTGQNVAGRRTTRFTLARRDAAATENDVNNERAAGGWSSSARRTAELSGMPAAATGKESTAVARSHDADNDEAPALERRDDGRRTSLDSSMPPDEVHLATQARPPSQPTTLTADAEETTPLPTTPDAQLAVEPELPPCLRFNTTRSALQQVGKARFVPVELRFCVPEDLTGHFEQTFIGAGTAASDGIHWMKAMPVRDDLTPALRIRGIRRYGGLGQLQRDEPRDPLAMGHDESYSVLSLSVLPDRPLRHHRVAAPQLLEKNSFRLMRLAGLDGNNRTFIAYFLNRAAGVCRGVKAGFMEIQVATDQSFSLTDSQNGYVFSSPTLPDFVAGLERLSGCRFLPPALADASALTIDSLMAAQPLFVHEHDTWCGKQDYDVQASNEDLALFAVRRLTLPGRDSHVDLYRQSFMLLDNRMIYSDADGTLRSVELIPQMDGQDAYVLGPVEGTVARFVERMGLQPGQRYPTLTLVEQLEDRGLTWMPAPPRLPPVAASPQREAAVSPSTYVLRGSVLQYVDHDGTAGTLRFTAFGRRNGTLGLALDNDVAGALFARRNGIKAGTAYAEADIEWVLAGQNFTRHVASQA